MSTGTPASSGGKRHLGNVLSGLAVALGCVLFLGGFVWGAVEYEPFTVPTNSMQPTVNPNDRVLAQRTHGVEPHRGDVVVFSDPVWGDLPLVKRVVGVGGDHVACCDAGGRLTVDGKPITEPYLDTDDRGRASATKFSLAVPAGRLFLLGDNRLVSEDSRAHLMDADHGTVPVADVTARVDATLWPMARLGELKPTHAFAGLPGGTSSSGPLTLIVWSIVLGVILIFGGAAYGPVATLFRRLGTRRSRVPVGGTA
ncbi:signal peptidase I [Streptomyces sp. SL13]|uniref:Signal peptidase I n=1 Tax=Streptantibioticus silvisoli TaxID=2705255 RepID=A0AA90H473_9ACTN|nr:signal peptidase I [Streptantibioticus silvisoli]MDI5967540.1 signal peptidase I [Streptantibioticus silvisoli]MDI5968495.1 signal peptidase I [Streptantibioticus silvisoli]